MMRLRLLFHHSASERCNSNQTTNPEASHPQTLKAHAAAASELPALARMIGAALASPTGSRISVRLFHLPFLHKTYTGKRLCCRIADLGISMPWRASPCRRRCHDACKQVLARVAAQTFDVRVDRRFAMRADRRM